MSNARSCTIKVNEFQKLLKESHEMILALSQENEKQLEAFQMEKKMLEQELSQALETIEQLKTKFEDSGEEEDVEKPGNDQQSMLVESEEPEITPTELPMINQVLPIEMFKKILEKLDIKSLCSTKQTCKYWKKTVCEFKLVEKASSRYLLFCFFT